MRKKLAYIFREEVEVVREQVELMRKHAAKRKSAGMNGVFAELTNYVDSIKTRMNHDPYAARSKLGISGSRARLQSHEKKLERPDPFVVAEKTRKVGYKLAGAKLQAVRFSSTGRESQKIIGRMRRSKPQATPEQRSPVYQLNK